FGRTGRPSDGLDDGERACFERFHRSFARPALLDDVLAKTLDQPFSEADWTGDELRPAHVLFEIAEHRVSARIALVAVRGQRLLHDREELALERKTPRRKLGDICCARLVQKGGTTFGGLVEPPPRQELPEDDADREHVCPRVEGIAARLLWAHVTCFTAN